MLEHTPGLELLNCEGPVGRPSVRHIFIPRMQSRICIRNCFVSTYVEFRISIMSAPIATRSCIKPP